MHKTLYNISRGQVPLPLAHGCGRPPMLSEAVYNKLGRNLVSVSVRSAAVNKVSQGHVEIETGIIYNS